MGAICISNFIYISPQVGERGIFLVCLSIWCAVQRTGNERISKKNFHRLSPIQNTESISFLCKAEICGDGILSSENPTFCLPRDKNTQRAAFSWADDLLLRKVVGSKCEKKKGCYQRGGGWKMKTVCLYECARGA
jgi:hypothetical protein